MPGPRRCKNPKRVAHPQSRRMRCGFFLQPTGIARTGEAKADRDSEAPPGLTYREPTGKARERSSGEIPNEALARTLEGTKPKGVTSSERAKPALAERNFRRKQSPGTAACRADPNIASGTTAGETVGGPVRVETFEQTGGRAPKGKSQERCRCETKPARDRREQAVRRVTKP